jgi:SprT protein
MTSFLGQLKLIFGHSVGQGTINALNLSAPRVIKRRRLNNQRQRDATLEERSRAMLFPLAPALAPLVTVGWNPRMRTTAGIAVSSRWEVWLNPSLRDISEAEVEKTLLHELAHLLAQHRHDRRRLAPHGPEWRQACRDLGIPGEKRTHQLPFVGRVMKRRYRLRCPGCGESHSRARKPRRRVACLACCRAHNGGAYDERFRFEVFTIAD